jgi:hypothetical protein
VTPLYHPINLTTPKIQTEELDVGFYSPEAQTIINRLVLVSRRNFRVLH